MARRRWFEFWKPRGLSREQILRYQLPVSFSDLQTLTRPPKVTPDHQEFGASGTPLAGGVLRPEDYNRDLTGKNAIATYDRMRRSDAQVKATLDLLELPLLAAEWDFVPPEHGDTTDQQIADFCKACILDDDAQRDTWAFTLRHILLMLPFGFSPFEKVWEVGPVGEYRYHRVAPRLPPSIDEFRITENGRLWEIVQRASKGEQEQELIIPSHPEHPEGDVGLVFVWRREGDNFNGMSVLRSAYKHWFYKDQLYNIDAISHERYGVGTPKAKLDPGVSLSPNEMKVLQAVLEGMRSHHRGYLILPPGVDVDILTPSRSIGGNWLMTSVEHHDVMIARNILAPFMNVGQAPNGTRSSTGELIDVFFTALEGVATSVSSDSKRQLVKPICDLNFPMEGRQYPTLVARNIRKVDIQLLADAMQKLKSASAITPDDPIENALRKIMGWEPLNPKLARPLVRPETALLGTGAPEAGPQAPGRVSPFNPASRASDATPTERVAATALRADPNNPRLRRTPTDLELQVLSFTEIPGRLDVANRALAQTIVAIREKQLRRLAELYAGGNLNPEVPYQQEIVRAITAMQKEIAEFGMSQVRLELRRQGAPIAMRADAEGPMSFAATLSSGQIGTRASILEHMRASAASTAQSLSQQLRTRVADEMLRQRRTNLRGAELATAIVDELDDVPATNVLNPVYGEVNEALSLGRQAQAFAFRDRITVAVQSALMDPATCAPCGNVDGEEMPFGSERQAELLPPFVDCVGRENCRCVQLYVYSGGV